MIRIPGKIAWPVIAAWGAGVLWYTGNRAIYHPFKHPRGAWDLQGTLGAADVWLEAADGVRLHGWWMAPAEARLATLYLHGNAGNITHRAPQAGKITAAGSAVLLLDYRGYGRSQGRPTEKGLYQDAEAGYRHLLSRGFRPERIVLHGESLGTAVAVDLAARLPCAGLILEAPFTSTREIAARILPVLGPLVMHSFDSRAKIAGVRAPLLVIHGDRDEVVPYELGRALFDAANPPKSFFTAAGHGHNDLPETAGYGERLAEFYRAITR